MGSVVLASMWWGYLVVVLFIILFVIFVIKIFIEFPGLTEWRFVFSDDEDLNSEDMELERVELGAETNINDITTADRKKKVAVKAAKADAEESSCDEIVSQSTADKHALLSNFMSS